MSRIEHNPPAFPVELAWGLEPGEPSQTSERFAQFPGMTLRDWFAGQALSNPAICTANSEYPQLDAYAFADAMLNARKKDTNA